MIRILIVAGAVLITQATSIEPARAQDERYLAQKDRSPAYKAGLRSAKRKGYIDDEKKHCFAKVFAVSATKTATGGWRFYGRASQQLWSQCRISY